MRERMVEDWIIETPFMVCGRDGEKGVLATSEFVDRVSCHDAQSKGTDDSDVRVHVVELIRVREQGNLAGGGPAKERGAAEPFHEPRRSRQERVRCDASASEAWRL